MFIIIRVVLLASLVKLLLEIDKPHVCAGIYTAVGLGVRLLAGLSLLPLLVATAGSFLLAWLYFWLLYRLEGSIWFWIVLVGGLVIGLV
jgi:hypothetical protein